MTGSSLPELVWPPVNLPRAAADQPDIQAYEAGLVALARVHHPTVTWWHGYRKLEDGYGSICYVCDEVIVKWDRFAPLPPDAVGRIAGHKMSHRAGFRRPRVTPNRRKAPR